METIYVCAASMRYTSPLMHATTDGWEALTWFLRHGQTRRVTVLKLCNGRVVGYVNLDEPNDLPNVEVSHRR